MVELVLIIEPSTELVSVCSSEVSLALSWAMLAALMVSRKSFKSMRVSILAKEGVLAISLKLTSKVFMVD